MVKKNDMSVSVPLPIILENGGKYVAAWCPLLDIATQGSTSEEAIKNMRGLVKWYFEDEDTPKPKIQTLMNVSISMTNIPVSLSKGTAKKHETSRSIRAQNC